MVLGVGEYSIYTPLVVVLCSLHRPAFSGGIRATVALGRKLFSINVSGFDGFLFPAVRRY
jgi:hypothetical protein